MHYIYKFENNTYKLYQTKGYSYKEAAFEFVKEEKEKTGFKLAVWKMTQVFE